MRCQVSSRPASFGSEPVQEADRDGREDQEEDDLPARERGARGLRLLLNVALPGVHGDVGHPASGLMLDAEAARSRAASNTSSSIGAVSRPVNVFCWEGWKQPSSGSGPPSPKLAPWPKRGRGRGDRQAAQRAQRAAPRPRRRRRGRRPRGRRRRSVELGAGPGQAGVALRGRRPVRGRRAAHGGGDPQAAQPQAVAGVARRRAGWRSRRGAARRRGSRRTGRR